MKKAKKAKAVSVEKANPVFEKLEQLTKVQRIAIWAGVLVLLIAAFVYFSYLPNLKNIDRLRTRLAKIENELKVAKKNARELNAYRKKMQEAEEQFKIVMRALPEKEEIPTLLTGISKAGRDSGLEFILFKPTPEIEKDFYAEIPVAMEVIGDYHGVATFFESVADLNRIVNIRDIDMKPDKESSKLLASCSAVTYKFIEASDKEKSGKRKKNSKKRNRKK
jgi:type IV pilus assembly protein PilO